MKKYIALIFLFAPLYGTSSVLPDNIYFKAMQAEMNRTKKLLHVKGSEKPFYIVYRLARHRGQTFSAEMGVPYARAEEKPSSGVSMAVYMYAGDAKQNSSGYVDNYYGYRVLSATSGDSYEALRQNLWQLTDLEYIKASTLAEKKQAYKRRKNLQQEPPDFSEAPAASFVEEITPFHPQDKKIYTQLVSELSAKGKELPYLERYSVVVSFKQIERYFLDSKQNFYQYQIPNNEVRFSAQFRNKDGYKQSFQLEESLPVDTTQVAAFIQKKSDEFLTYIRQQYNAVKAEPYIGPVLFKSEAASGLFNSLFIQNVRNTKPLLSAQREIDSSAGLFKDKLNMRVISPLFNVFDRPQARQYKGRTLSGFMPVDAEGVKAQELQLVENGKLKTLPTMRSLIQGQTRSNGHARSGTQMPRANVTNVFFEPTQTYTSEQLEEKLLQRCRELGLEYGYIFHSFPSIIAQRIYVDDGHKENVYGIKLEGITPRSLRDIVAAGEDSEVSLNGNVSIIAPSVLVEEIEFVPSQQKPDRPPFVPLPK